jgi:hypothetical protein
VSGESGGARPGSPGTFTPRERAAHYLASGLVAGSGLLVAGWKYLSPPSDDPYQAFSHPWLPHALHAHVLAAPVWLLAIGWILRDHIVGRWRSAVHRRGRRTGVIAAVLLLPMAGSGYLLQTATSEGWRRALVWIHVVSSLAYIVGFVAHAVIGRLGTARTARARAVGSGPRPARSLRAAGGRRNP